MEFRPWSEPWEQELVIYFTCNFILSPLLLSAGSSWFLLRCSLWWPDSILIVWVERWQNHYFTDGEQRCSIIAYTVMRRVLVFSSGFHLWVSDMPLGASFFVCLFFMEDLDIFLEVTCPWRFVCVLGTSGALCFSHCARHIFVLCWNIRKDSDIFELAMPLCPVWGELILFLLWMFCSITDDSVLPDLCNAWRASGF